MNHTEKVPFLDLVTPHRELETHLIEVFRKSIQTAGFIGGPMVDRFECDFARFCEVRQCIGVASGTDAVRFALMAAGVKPGDLVISVSMTFIATTEAISQAGADPVFVDVDERTCNMDPEKVREYLETQCDVDSKTGRPIDRKTGRSVSAIVPVHLYGQMADMDAILDLAGRYNLTVIEDACQAHGAKYFSKKENRWRIAGSMGHAAAFSFYPGKNLGACGEGGAVTTDDEQIARAVRLLRDHGQNLKYHHELIGYNGRLDSVQAGILAVKLPHLASWNEKRRERAQNYNQLFSSVNGRVIIPFEPSWSKAIYHLYVVRVQNRDQLREHLAAAGIGTGIHYPIPVHLQRAYSSLGYRKESFPVTERIASEGISLPMFPQLDSDSQDLVVREVGNFVAEGVSSTRRPEPVPTAS